MLEYFNNIYQEQKEEVIDCVSISQETVLRYTIKTLKIRKAARLDNLPNELMQYCEDLACELTTLFNKILDSIVKVKNQWTRRRPENFLEENIYQDSSVSS